MWCIVLRRFLIIVIILSSGCSSLSKLVDLRRATCSMCCKFAQPRSVVLAKEIPGVTATFPYMTVLHRCDEGSGCCKDTNKICEMSKMESLNISLYVKYPSTSFRQAYYQVRNHTECQCNIPGDIPK